MIHQNWLKSKKKVKGIQSCRDFKFVINLFENENKTIL